MIRATAHALARCATQVTENDMGNGQAATHRSHAGGSDRRSTPRWRATLLELALSAGGDYADLFFEYRAGADYVYEDEQRQGGRARHHARPRRARHQGRRHRLRLLRGADLGGDGRGGAHRGADRAGGQVAGAGRHPRAAHPQLLPGGGADAGDAGAGQARAACAAAIARRAPYDPRIIKVSCSFAEELKEILIVTSRRASWRAIASR